MRKSGLKSSHLFRTLILCASLAPAASSRATEKIAWKPVAEAVLKINEQPVKLWNVYQTAKKSHLVLVQLGQRFLMLDAKQRRVYEIEPAALERKGNELLARDAEKRGKLLPSADWSRRDVGPAELIRVRLSDENRVLEVQLPHPLDLRMAY